MERKFKNLFGLIKEKSVPPIDSVNERTREGLPKAYIPKFLYKPPFGYPRFVDLPTIRRLASMPYVEMCISTIVDEISAVPWDIVLEEDIESNETKEKEIRHIKDFFENPNTNKESFEEIRRKYVRDILEVDSGVLIKMFNPRGEMVEIMARDGSTFTKNPDIYGRIVDREDLIIDPNIATTNKEMTLMEPGWITAADAREKAAYFQYGWITGARPVPFGKKEIVWFERNPRTDSIYGRSPVEILMNTIQTLIYAIEHNLEYFSDNSIPKGIIGLEGADTEAIKAFKVQWEEQQRKKDSAGNWKKKFHHVPVVGKSPIFTRLQFTNAELELIESQKWWAKMVWACFGVTATELGYTEDAKGLANQIVQSNVFRKRAINPLLRLEEYRYNQEVISEFYMNEKKNFVSEETSRLEKKGIIQTKAIEQAELKAEEKLKKKELPYQGIKFKFLMFDVEEETKKASLYKIQLDAGYKSVNEIRTEEGMEEVDWGEKMSEQERFDMNNQFGDNGEEDSFGPEGAMKKEENDKKKKVEKEKENMQGVKKKNEKSIETKPFGEYASFAECVRKNQDKRNPEAYCAELEKKITGKWPGEKAENPLILGEFETMDDLRLKQSIVYLLQENEKKIKGLIKKEMGNNKLINIKSVDDVAKRIGDLVTFQGLKAISDAVIKHTFMRGWDSAEKQLDRNFMVNKEAIEYIKDYTFNNISVMAEEIKHDLRQELERGIMSGEGITKLTGRVDKIFNKGENRAEMIARTETNRAENQGKLQAFKSSGERYNKKWSAVFDKRTSEICKRLDGKVVGMNENFKDKQTGWEGPVPPAHVDCRSSVVFILKE